VFFALSHFHSSLIFESKDGAKEKTRIVLKACLKYSARETVTGSDNTPAYYVKKLISNYCCKKF